MICDSMRSFGRYGALAPEAWEKINVFLNDICGKTVECGKYELIPDKLWVNVIEAVTKPESEGVYEAHREFVDIHIPLCGSERLLALADACDLRETSPYNSADDYVLYATDQGVAFEMEPGYFMLFFPGEPHQVLIGGGRKIRKAIVKLHRSLLK